MLLMSGIVMAVTPLVSQLRGAGQLGAAGAVVRQALWIAVSGGIALALLLQNVEPVYRLALKVPLNWLFIYGDPALGVPAMGGALAAAGRRESRSWPTGRSVCRSAPRCVSASRVSTPSA